MATIDPSWVELQTGLYLEEYDLVIGGTTYLRRELHSSDGYCFYDLGDKIYDEEGNLIPADQIQPNQRIYYQYTSLALAQSSWTYEQLNARYISVPVDPSYEIVSVTTSNVDI